MSYRFSDPVGPATTARCQLPSDERLLWATYGFGAYYYDVEGFDQLGERKKNVVLRGLRSVGNAAGDFANEALGATDPSSDAPRVGGVFILGRKDGLAHDLLSASGAPGNELRCLWALTTRRLVLFGPAPGPEPEGLGRILFGFGKDVAKAVTGTAKKSYGDHVEGQPVVIQRRAVLADVPRERIAGLTPARHGRRPCLRVSFVDGSALDLLDRSEDPAVYEWMAR